MDLLEKFSAVEIQTDSRITEADRQFLQRQQNAYQDAVTGFYQIGTLWSDMRAQQKAALLDPENRWECWETKYLTSDWWHEIDVNHLMKHIFFLHKTFLCGVVSYLNEMYHLSINANVVLRGLLPQEPAYIRLEDEDKVDWSPVVLRYQDAIEQILPGFDGRTFAEQAPYELLENCRRAAWNKDRTANYEWKKVTVKLLSGACDYGYYRGHEQWYIHDSGKNVLKAAAYFEAGGFQPYPYEINELLSDTANLWYDLWELDGCEKLDRIKLYKNGRMDIRFTSEGYARQFVSDYFGTMGGLL